MITHRGIDGTVRTFQGEMAETKISKITKILRKHWQVSSKGVNFGVVFGVVDPR